MTDIIDPLDSYRCMLQTKDTLPRWSEPWLWSTLLSAASSSASSCKPIPITRKTFSYPHHRPPISQHITQERQNQLPLSNERCWMEKQHGLSMSNMPLSVNATYTLHAPTYDIYIYIYIPSDQQTFGTDAPSRRVKARSGITTCRFPVPLTSGSWYCPTVRDSPFNSDL